MSERMKRLAWSAALLWLAGCASAPPPTPAPRTPPPAASGPPATSGPGTQVGTTASGGTISVHTTPGVAVGDSTPSPDALAVLHTIPEPLGGPSSESTTVPVPAPTEALGQRPRASAAPDAASPPAKAGAAGSAAGGAVGGAAVGGASAGAAGASSAKASPAASPDSCWRVQVLAPPEKDRADRMAQAAESQLGVPFVVEREGELYKVRTRDCLTSNAATSLKNRAIADGFDGSFRFLKPR